MDNMDSAYIKIRKELQLICSSTGYDLLKILFKKNRKNN